MRASLKADFPKADLVIVLGTSLKIAPMVSTLRCFKAEAMQVLINREAVVLKPEVSEGFDLVLLGDCDDVVAKLCTALGWNLPAPPKAGTTRSRNEDVDNGSNSGWSSEGGGESSGDGGSGDSGSGSSGGGSGGGASIGGDDNSDDRCSNPVKTGRVVQSSTNRFEGTAKVSTPASTPVSTPTASSSAAASAAAGRYCSKPSVVTGSLQMAMPNYDAFYEVSSTRL